VTACGLPPDGYRIINREVITSMVLTRTYGPVIALAFGVVLTLAYRPVIAVVSGAAMVLDVGYAP
jgi:hypothetical protein